MQSRITRYPFLSVLSPGLEGRVKEYQYGNQDIIVISDFIAYEEVRGKGAAKEYLKKLEDEYDVVIPLNVLNSKLRNALVRRGYIKSKKWPYAYARSKSSNFNLDKFLESIEEK